MKRSNLVNKGLSAMVASLDDPYSHFYSPSDYRAFLSDSNPHFGGIGVSVFPGATGLRVIDVFPNSPAARSGLQRGDVIVDVNSTRLAGHTAQFASGLIRGKPGTSVSITALRGGRTLHFSIVRAERVPAGRERADIDLSRREDRPSRLHDDSAAARAICSAPRFARRSARELRPSSSTSGGTAAGSSRRRSTSRASSSPTARRHDRGRTQPTQVYSAENNAIAPKIPMAVLVDRGTASAAEIVTGALQDHHRALVVGTRTYGKGVFQEIQPMPGGGALDITVGEYFTPNGQNLGGGGVKEGKGIKPNVYASTPLTSTTDTALITAERVVASETHKMTPAASAARVALIERRGKFLVAEPFFAPGPRFAVTRDRRASVGDLVVVRPGAQGSGRPPARGGRAVVSRRLGRPDVARDVLEALMVDRGLARLIR